MPVLIGLLRGVNVGGKNKIKMDALRDLCGSLELRGPVTHLNSGNVVFEAPARAVPKLAARMESAIESACGFRTNVILRTAAEFAAVIERNPFAGRELDPAKVLVYFVGGEVSAEARTKISAITGVPEEVRITACELYIHFAIGMARPKLSLASIDRALKAPATGRNWNTVLKLLEIAQSLE